MPYFRDPYVKTPWIDVANPNDPPIEAEELSADNLNKLEEGIRATRESLHLVATQLLQDEFDSNIPADRYPLSSSVWQSVTTGPWSSSGLVLTVGGSPTHQVLFSGGQLFIRQSLTGSKTEWAANTAYALNAIVQPITMNGYYYRVTTAGTSGSLEPNWPTDSTPVTNGTAVFTLEGRFWSGWASYVFSTDTRLTDARTPTAHAASHSTGGTDAIVAGNIGAVSVNFPTFSGRLVSNVLADTTVLATTTLAASSRLITTIRADSALTMSGATPIAAGVNGQIVNLMNTGTAAITLTATGTNLTLPGGNVVLNQWQSVQFVYLTAPAKWIQMTPKVGA